MVPNNELNVTVIANRERDDEATRNLNGDRAADAA